MGYPGAGPPGLEDPAQLHTCAQSPAEVDFTWTMEPSCCGHSHDPAKLWLPQHGAYMPLFPRGTVCSWEVRRVHVCRHSVDPCPSRAGKGTFSTAVRSSEACGLGVEDSRSIVFLKGTQGTSVLFHVTRPPEVSPEAKLEKISWAVKNESNYIDLLHVFPGVNVPEWVNVHDKFKERLHVHHTTTLRIDKLTLEDCGWYQARCSFSTGIENAQYFHLSVYEPIPRPQVLAEVLSLTQDWCNVTLECHTPGTTGAVSVSWESKGLPRELEQKGAPGSTPNPWTLALNLPLSQPSPRVTCVVSSPVDQTTATRDLGEVCGHERETRPHGQAGAAHLGAILGAFVVVLLILGAGLYLRRSRGERKSLETGRGRQPAQSCPMGQRPGEPAQTASGCGHSAKRASCAARLDLQSVCRHADLPRAFHHVT
ncbi:SLAM family member 5-like [Crocuta crocuta]